MFPTYHNLLFLLQLVLCVIILFIVYSTYWRK